MKLIPLIASFVLIFNYAFSQQKVFDQGKPLYITVGGEKSSIRMSWLEPVPGLKEINNSLCTLKIGLNSIYELKEISVYLNDNPVSEERGLIIVESQDPLKFDMTFQARVVLKNGINKLIISTVDEKGFAYEESREIKLVVPELLRTDYALLFATDIYDHWKPLINPVNDASTIVKELKNDYGFQAELVVNATLDSMMRKLKQYSDKSYMDNDQLFIFFAGHGYFDESFRDGYLVCRDSKLNDPGNITFISHTNLRSIINNIPVKHIFLVMDACFGGTFDPVLAAEGYRGDENDNEMTDTEFIIKKLKYTTRRYLTSGGKEYVPDGLPGHHSPFVRRFLEALRSFGGRDKILTVPEIYSFVEKLQPGPKAGEFGKNEPGSDFIFVYKEEN